MARWGRRADCLCRRALAPRRLRAAVRGGSRAALRVSRVRGPRSRVNAPQLWPAQTPVSIQLFMIHVDSNRPAGTEANEDSPLRLSLPRPAPGVAGVEWERTI